MAISPPHAHQNSHKLTWLTALREAQATLDTFVNNPSQLEKCEKFSQILIESFRGGGRLFTCGNGGSHCDAMHFAEEFTGRYRKDRRPLGALALGDASHVTCVSNDYGFEHIFSRQLEALGKKGDVLIGISTSGNSKNVLKALETARTIGIKTIGVTGGNGGSMLSHCDLSLVASSPKTARTRK